jgi:hypothetical protein
MKEARVTEMLSTFFGFWLSIFCKIDIKRLKPTD